MPPVLNSEEPSMAVLPHRNLLLGDRSVVLYVGSVANFHSLAATAKKASAFFQAPCKF